MSSGQFRVDFMGGAGNLQQWVQSLRGAGSQIRSAWQSSASSPVTSLKLPNVSTGNITTQIDSYNRTLIQSGQIFHRYVAGYTSDIQKLESATRSLGAGGTGLGGLGASAFGSYGTRTGAGGRVVTSAKDIKPVYENLYQGEFKQTAGNLQQIMAAQTQLIPYNKRMQALQKTAVVNETRYQNEKRTVEERAAEVQRLAAPTMREMEKQTTGIRGKLTATGNQWLTPTAKEYQAIYDAKTKGGTPLFATKNAATGVMEFDQKKAYKAIQANKVAPQPKIQAALRGVRDLDAIDASLRAWEAEYAATTGLLTGVEKRKTTADKKLLDKGKGLRKEYRKGLNGLSAAMNAVSPISQDLDYFLQNSKGFRKDFLSSMGIKAPYVAPIADAAANATPAEKAKIAAAQARIAPARTAFAQELSNKGITADSIKANYDFEKGVYRISGGVNRLNGIQGDWSSTIDKNMQKVDRLGGSLRGTGGFLRQTTRDFQKVIQWTVATSLVFGALGMAVGSVSKINTVNKDLIRFSLTARTSASETKAAFQDIVKIAYDTATPLTELTSVMDDIALATRRSGQTAKEWGAAMSALAESVGILTNVAGIDTQKATDLLSAAYKQMRIMPEQLIGVLNKVTAVAGGNAMAIQDIVAALGSVSEAASASGLSLDEQIASVQTLSQVTNKTSADIATSFKNLFGAISSNASVKVLDKFGISVRTATGELRPFLEIYNDIYKARQSGRISEGQLQDVLRGISGGPRRAPDAAALLANIPLIFENIDKAASASNEVLIANTRIMDTNAAKMQQLRNQFDTALIENFTESINKLIKAIYEIGTVFGNVLGGANSSGLVAFVGQLGFMSIAAMGFLKVSSLLKRGIGGLRLDFSKLAADEKIAAGNLNRFGNAAILRPGSLPAIQGLQRVGKGDKQRYIPTKAANALTAPPPQFTMMPANPNIKDKIRVGGINTGKKVIGSTKGRMALGALAAGGAFAASTALVGGLNPESLSTLASAGQALGMTLAFIGGPVGIAAGVTLATLSTGLQLWAEGETKAAEKAKDLKISIHANVKSLEEEQNALDKAKTAQKDASAVMEELNKKKNLSAEETNQLAQAELSYVDSSFAISDANKTISETIDKLLIQIPQLKEVWGDLAGLDLTNLNPEVRKDLSQKLAASILSLRSPGAIYGELDFSTAPKPSTAIAGRAPGRKLPGEPQAKSAEDLYKDLLAGGPEAAIKLLSTQSQTGVNIDAKVIDLLKSQVSMAQNDPLLKDTKETAIALRELGKWANLISGTDGVKLSNNIAIKYADLLAGTSLELYSADEQKQGLARAKAAQTLQDLSDKSPTGGRGQRGPSWGVAAANKKTISDYIFNNEGKGGLFGSDNWLKEFNLENAREYLSKLQLVDPTLKDLVAGTELFDKAAVEAWSRAGGEVLDFDGKVIQTTDDVKTLQEEIAASVITGKQGLFNDLLTLQAQKQGGEFDSKNAKEDAALNASFNAQVSQKNKLVGVWDQLGAAFVTNAKILPEYLELLGKVHTFRGIELTDLNQLLPTLINYAQTLGLTGGQVDIFKNQLLALLKIADAMADVRMNFHLAADMPTEKVLAFLKLLKATAEAAWSFSSDGTPKGSNAIANNMYGLGSINAAIALAEKEIRGTKAIDDLLAKGRGTDFGKVPTASGGGGGGSNKPGLLDIPEEFKLDQNRTVSELIALSIKSAKELQSKIPGETKANKNAVVAILDGTKKLKETKGIGEEYLRRAMEELTAEIKKQNDLLLKTDKMSQIRVGAGSFAAIANVPMSAMGISTGGPGQPINVNLSVNGQILTPAQLDQLANLIAAQILAGYSA